MNSATESSPYKDLRSVLQGIGLTNNQATIYLTVLELGTSSIWHIAQRSGLKRSTCYSLLSDLIEKGYASQTNDVRRTLFSVTSPKRLLLSAKVRVDRLARSLDQLEALAEHSLQQPAIRFYSGMEGIKEVYLSCLDLPKGQELYIMSDPIRTMETHHEVMEEYIARRVAKKIPMKGIFVESPENRAINPENTSLFRTVRYLEKKDLNIMIESQIAGNKVAYISHSKHEPFAMIIENSVFAEQERQRFMLLWKVSKP